MKGGSLHTRSFKHIHFSVFRYRWFKNGFTGPKTFRGFRETGPWESEEWRRTIGSPTCTYCGQFGFIHSLGYGSFLASQHDTYFSRLANCDRGLHQKQPRESRYSNDTTVVRSVLIHILFCEPKIPLFFSVRALGERPARGNESLQSLTEQKDKHGLLDKDNCRSVSQVMHMGTDQRINPRTGISVMTFTLHLASRTVLSTVKKFFNTLSV